VIGTICSLGTVYRIMVLADMLLQANDSSAAAAPSTAPVVWVLNGQESCEECTEMSRPLPGIGAKMQLC
jgi:hypothetical protein